MTRLLSIPVMLLLASPATAQFEGRAEYTYRGERGGGRMTILVSKAGARTDLSLPSQGSGDVQHLTTLFRASDPRRVYFINDERRTYSVVDLPQDDGDSARYKVERLGRDRIGGHDCEKAAVTAEGTGRVEACVTKELGAMPAFGAFRGGRGKGNFFPALQRAGLTGLPVRWQTIDVNGKVESTFELASATREKVPAEKLAVPAGYQQGSPFDTVATPEQQRQLEERMGRIQEQLEQLPPEQRRRVEQMMREGSAGTKR